MAISGVCEHCSASVRSGDVVSRDGYSYHKKCHKCYVCSETDLHDAEVFRGVMFCGGCAKRIFRGCATARIAKPARAQHRAQERLRKNIENSVLERVRAAPSTGSSHSASSPEESKDVSVTRAPVTQDCYCVQDFITRGRKLFNFIYSHSQNRFKTGNEITNPTTQRILEALSPSGSKPCSPSPPQPTRASSTVKTTSTPEMSARSPQRRRKRVSTVKIKEKQPCSDLRMAELGTSTEIANMALRTTSAKGVKSETITPQTDLTTYSMFSNINPVSSHTSKEVYLDSECEEYRGSNKDSDRGILDHTIASLFKIPYKFFKNKILDRSSLISVIAGMDSDSEKGSFYKRVKMLFHEETLDHRRNGYKKLYPTINKRNTHRLGWPDHNGHRNIYPCKHFQECHSYRCMREHVMRLAGPTESKINVYISNMKKLVVPWFLNNLSIKIRTPATLKTTACGRSASFVPREKTGPGTAHYHPVPRYVPAA